MRRFNDSIVKVRNRQSWGVLSCAVLPAAKKALLRLTAKTNIAAGSELTELRWLAANAVNAIGKSQLTHWHYRLAAIEVDAKVIFDENGPLYIFVGETEGFCYFQEENGK